MDDWNFDIYVDRTAGDGGALTYRVWATDTAFGETPRIQRSIEISSAVLREGLERLAHRQTDHPFLIEFGTWLYRQLIAPEIEALLSRSLVGVRVQPEMSLRVRLRLDPPEIGHLPWELLYAPRMHAFLSTREDSPVVRYTEMMRRIPALEARTPLHLLVAIPGDVAPFPALDVERERRVITRALEGRGGEVKAHFLEGDVTFERLTEALAAQAYHGFHFVGHGGFKNERGSLVLNAPGGGAEEVDETRFAELFNGHPSMKLVVLNACQSATLSSSRRMVGVASQLVGLGVPAVVAMQFTLYDDAAVLFAREFYRSLFRGPSKGRVDIAVCRGRGALAEAMPAEREMATPVLFMRARNGILFEPITGRRLRDLAYSPRARRTEKLVRAAHEQNLELLEQAMREAPDDPELQAALVRERAESARLRHRIRLRNRLVGGALVVVALMFCLSFVRAFDVLGLDTRIETATLALGGWLDGRPFSDEIALVAIEEDARSSAGHTFEQAARSWRADHALLLERLAAAGARAVVLNFHFGALDPSRGDDRALLDAIRAAEGRGLRVVLSALEVQDGRLRLPELLHEAASGVGLACVGEKLGVAVTAPLLLEKPGGPALPSLVLATLAAARGVKADGAAYERAAGAIRVAAGDASLALGYSELSVRRRGAGRCPATEAGDVIADLFIDLTPKAELRAAGRRHAYSSVAREMDAGALRRAFENRIVFVGAAVPAQRTEVAAFGDDTRYNFELFADAVNTALQGVVIRPLGLGGQFLILLAFGLTGASLCYWGAGWAPGLRVGLLFLITTGYLLATVYVFARYSLLLNTLYHVGALWLAYGVALRIRRRWFF